MASNFFRTPRNYDGTQPTGRHIRSLLTPLLRNIEENYAQRPDLILASWPSIIGEKLASMTQAYSFQEGLLVVKVKNSTLYSLLAQHEKIRLLRALKERFPTSDIRDIVFRMG